MAERLSFLRFQKSDGFNKLSDPDLNARWVIYKILDHVLKLFLDCTNEYWSMGII